MILQANLLGSNTQEVDATTANGQTTTQTINYSASRPTPMTVFGG